MTDHGARAHARWSASSTAANWACPGRLALVESLNLPDRESEAAAWGTACHQVSEKCLRGDQDAADLIGTTETTKEHSFEVDEEMAETAQMYIDYVRERSKCGALGIEKHFSLAALNPPLEAGGTADAVIWRPEDAELEIVDLKGGRGVVVEAAGNPQGRTYATGAMLEFGHLPVQTVRVTIVQPRAPHASGRIRSDVFHVADLVSWAGELIAAMQRAENALRRYAGGGALWEQEHLVPGDHCDKSFCPARAVCPALERKVMDAAAIWLDAADEPHIAASNQPDALSPAELAKRLDVADLLESWISAVRAYAHAQAEMGVSIPDYVLVEKQGREKWNDGTEAEAARLAVAAGVPENKVFNPAKIRTPKQVRDALAKAKKTDVLEAIKALSSTPKTGTNLVRADNTSRPAVAPSVERFLDPS